MRFFELADAVLCAGGPVRALAGLSLAPEHRRGHGALYDAVNSGRIEITRLRRCLAGLPLPRAADGRLMLAVDVSNWLRPGAATSPDRLFCHVYGRGKGQAQMIPGWPYSVVAALEPGRTSWTAVLDAIRLGPGDDEAEVTAAQVREVITRLITAGHWRDGDPPILVIFDAGYDPMRLAHQLADLPVEILGRLRSDRVLHFPVLARQPGTNGRPPRHGREFALPDPATWPDPAVTTTTQTTRYGTAVAQAWDRLHPRLTHRSAWLDHDGPLPVIEGTLIRLQVHHLPGDRDPKPVSGGPTGAGPRYASARHPDHDEGSDGLVLGLVRNMFAAGNEDTASLMQYVYVSSAFYPDIQRYYVSKISELVLELRHPGESTGNLLARLPGAQAGACA